MLSIKSEFFNSFATWNSEFRFSILHVVLKFWRLERHDPIHEYVLSIKSEFFNILWLCETQNLGLSWRWWSITDQLQTLFLNFQNEMESVGEELATLWSHSAQCIANVKQLPLQSWLAGFSMSFGCPNPSQLLRTKLPSSCCKWNWPSKKPWNQEITTACMIKLNTLLCWDTNWRPETLTR